VTTGLARRFYVTALPTHPAGCWSSKGRRNVASLRPRPARLQRRAVLDVRTTNFCSDAGLLDAALAFSAGRRHALSESGGTIEVRGIRPVAGTRGQLDPRPRTCHQASASGFNNHNGGWIDFGPTAICISALAATAAAVATGGNGTNAL
jgi:hypothetical protein